MQAVLYVSGHSTCIQRVTAELANRNFTRSIAWTYHVTSRCIEIRYHEKTRFSGYLYAVCTVFVYVLDMFDIWTKVDLHTSVYASSAPWLICTHLHIHLLHHGWSAHICLCIFCTMVDLHTSVYASSAPWLICTHLFMHLQHHGWSAHICICIFCTMVDLHTSVYASSGT